MSRPLRVLHVIEPAAEGGAESVVRALAGMADGAGSVQSEVATLIQHTRPHPFVDGLRRQGATVHEVRCGRRRYDREIGALAALIGSQSIDILHTHVYHADLVGYFAARRAGIPAVATMHGFTGAGWKGRMYERLDLWALRRLQGVICVSEGLRDQAVARGCPPDRVVVIPNGYRAVPPLSREEARRALGLPPEGPIAGWVGRLSREKGPDTFIDAVSSGSISAALIGDGPEAGPLAGQIARLGCEDRVTLLGARPEAGRLMTAFDVLVISSRTEGSPIGLLEAVHAGVPVVAFAVGGIPALLDETTAWLVPPGNTEALAGAVEEALRRPEEAARRAERATVRLRERHGPEQWLGRIRTLYEKVAST